MSEELKQDYSQMVKDLSKPGEEILGTLTIQQAHLIHMLMGLSGEILSELTTSDSVENTKEELGDIEFYFEGLKQAWGVGELPEYVPMGIMQGLPPQVGMYVIIGELIDTIKKHVIYGKPFDMDRFLNLMAGIEMALTDIYKMLKENFSREEVLEGNMEKLLKGDKARYKEGKYTDQQAVDRQDKQ